MIDPFTAWSRMISAGLDMQSTWLCSVETLQASHVVIGARTDTMRTAAARPLHADIGELSRMVPEKVDAFGRSARNIVREAFAMQNAWTRQTQRFMAVVLSGRIPTIAETSALTSQTLDYALNAITAGARLSAGALAPIHRTVTSNARRLNKAA